MPRECAWVVGGTVGGTVGRVDVTASRRFVTAFESPPGWWWSLHRRLGPSVAGWSSQSRRVVSAMVPHTAVEKPWGSLVRARPG